MKTGLLGNGGPPLPSQANWKCIYSSVRVSALSSAPSLLKDWLWAFNFARAAESLNGLKKDVITAVGRADSIRW